MTELWTEPLLLLRPHIPEGFSPPAGQNRWCQCNEKNGTEQSRYTEKCYQNKYTQLWIQHYLVWHFSLPNLSLSHLVSITKYHSASRKTPNKYFLHSLLNLVYNEESGKHENKQKKKEMQQGYWEYTVHQQLQAVSCYCSSFYLEQISIYNSFFFRNVVYHWTQTCL